MEYQDGGSAFPFHAPNGGPDPQSSGLSLRDYFAAKAMQGDMASQEPNVFMLNHCITDEELSAVCRHWYRIADAMLEARK